MPRHHRLGGIINGNYAIIIVEMDSKVKVLAVLVPSEASLPGWQDRSLLVSSHGCPAVHTTGVYMY